MMVATFFFLFCCECFINFVCCCLSWQGLSCKRDFKSQWDFPGEIIVNNNNYTQATGLAPVSYHRELVNLCMIERMT